MARARRRARKDAAAHAKRAAVTRTPVPPLAIAGAVLLLLACAVPIALWGDPYPPGIARYWLVGGVAVAAVAILAAALPSRLASSLSQWCGAALDRPSPAAFAVTVAGIACALSLVLAFYAFERYSSTSDELAQLWHAKILAHGRLSLPADPNPEFFALENVVDTGRWYSQFPIGGPLLLAGGVLLGVPWLVNPLLAGGAAAALYHFGRRAYGETQGRAIATVFSVTPLVLMMAGTYMNHVPTLFLAACALAALAEWDRATSPRGRAAYAACIGVTLGGMATIRPLDAVAVASVVGLFQLAVVRRDGARARDLAVQTVAGAMAVAPLLYANYATTGHALRFGYDVIWGEGHRVGFHADPLGSAHTLGRALEYAMTYVNALNPYLMAWPVPPLLVAIAGLLAARSITRWDVVLFGLFAAQVVAYAAYWGIGDFLGPRFLFTALPALIVLLARAPFLVGDRFGGSWRRAAVAFTLACVVVAWAAPASARYGVWGLATQVHDTRRAFKLDIAGAVRDADLHHALVFLRDPLGGRIMRRLWALGVPRGDAAQLLATRDACSLLAAVRAAEGDTATSGAVTTQLIARAAAPYVPGELAIGVGDPNVHISSEASLSGACRAELEDDARLGTAPFGPALPLEPISADGRLDGDVIYAADLGERNQVLRARFGDRTWHRLSAARMPDGTLRAVLAPY